MIPILLTGKGGQTIMAGDPKQMPPIVIDNFARDRGLENSFMGRLFERYSKIVDDTMMVSSTNQIHIKTLQIKKMSFDFIIHNYR